MSLLCVASDGGNDIFKSMVGIHRDTLSNQFVNLLPLETFHVGMVVLI